MTEAQWLHATDPRAMLEFLRTTGRASDRKLRLFAAACCRRVWNLLTDERSRRAVEVVERFADGLVGGGELSEAREDAHAADFEALPARRSTYLAAATASHAAAEDAAETWAAAYLAHTDDADLQGEPQVPLLRCIFGNPFRPPPALDPSLLNPDIVALAQSIYQERKLPEGTLDPARLAPLADMLEEAGCDDAELLGHLRSAGPHVRGCVAVDAILGRE